MVSFGSSQQQPKSEREREMIPWRAWLRLHPDPGKRGRPREERSTQGREIQAWYRLQLDPGAGC